MTSPQQIEILDLRHFTARQLRPLLEQEAARWQTRLRWDYRASTELLLQYLDSRILPGFVALDRGRVCGFCFCVYEAHKAVIGDIYSAQENPSPLAVTHTLTRHLLETLEASPGVDRIEAQLLLYDTGALIPAFAGSGFISFERLFLELDLAQPVRLSPLATPTDLELCAWTPSFYQHAAELIHAAYQGHVDSEINDQYQTLAGSIRFLHNVIRFPGCGQFDPEASWALRDRHTGALVAVILCSRVSSGVAHVTQLCVAPAFLGRRLGRLLLAHTIANMPAHRYEALTLTVSRANGPALHLYGEAGFRTRQTFDALVLNKAKRAKGIRRLTLLSR